MKKISYTMELLSSLIISPRSAHALYKDVDDFFPSTNIKTTEKNLLQAISIIYPFYQYGAYEKYDPDNTEYYLPGSSIKGAFKQNNKKLNHFMADDIVVPYQCIVLRHLWKAQYLEDIEVSKAKFDTFFENVGIEMIKDETNLKGEVYLEDTIQFSEILNNANEDAKNKMNQMCEYLNNLQKKGYTNEVLKKNLHDIVDKLSSLKEEDNVILIGGYKGLLHSIVLGDIAEIKGALFIDSTTMLPHGLVRINFE